jgi:hypothetical protein
VFFNSEVIMTLTSELTIRLVVAVAIDLAIACACYAVLSLFIWSWLAAILALIAAYFAAAQQHVVAAKVSVGHAAVAGAAKALNWYRSLRGNTEVIA